MDKKCRHRGHGSYFRSYLATAALKGRWRRRDVGPARGDFHSYLATAALKAGDEYMTDESARQISVVK